VPTTGIHRFLDPRLVCTDCGYLWTPTEAAAGGWSRGDRTPEAPGALGYPITLAAHLGCGSILLLILGFMWYWAERNGWCGSSWDYQAIQDCISGQSTRDTLRILRPMVPILTIVWLINGWSIIRKRAAGCVTTSVTATMIFVAFLLLLIMG
jgi:hypothetical protein